jgi:mannosyl-oligosaccharide alpha-1,2-mannosidase
VAAPRQAMAESWAAYEKYAWGCDELQPLSRTGNNKFGGLGATLVDSLDTLLLMGMHEEYLRCAPRVHARA